MWMSEFADKKTADNEVHLIFGHFLKICDFSLKFHPVVERIVETNIKSKCLTS